MLHAHPHSQIENKHCELAGWVCSCQAGGWAAVSACRAGEEALGARLAGRA